MTNYRWWRWGDLNAYFGLMIDNVAVMGILVASITSTLPIEQQAAQGRIGFSPEFVLTRMLPGTALGVLFGDLLYSFLAWRLARKTGREDVTAMPLGLDTPSTFGISFFVLVPALQMGWSRLADAGLSVEARHREAMEFAWHIGVATLVASGVIKVICAFFGNIIRRLVPRAGLLGSLAAIALALIAFLPLVMHQIAAVPVVGMAALLVILVTLVAHRELPGRFPGMLASLLLGTALFYIGRLAGFMPPLEASPPQLGFNPSAMISFYWRDAQWWSAVAGATATFFPVALPFALATVVGGIDCTESAAAAGDEYDTVSILLIEGGVSLLAGLLGGVIQTTPYIGHPAYKKMGGGAGYTVATGLTVGLVGVTGLVSVLFAIFPEAALFPILVFVGIEITAASFHHTPVKHYPALAIGFLPALAALAVVILGNVHGPNPPFNERGYHILQTLRCLSSGFIVSGLVWSAALAMILDGRLKTAAGYMIVGAVCAFFGIIHSPLSPEKLGVPWDVMATIPPEFKKAVEFQSPYHWTAAYVLMGLLLLGLAVFDPKPQESDTTRDEPTSPA